jgi:ribosome-associated protein
MTLDRERNDLQMENKTDMSHATSREVAEKLVHLLDLKGASNIKLYDVSQDTTLTDFHLIATGRSSTHVKALADDLDYEMSACGVSPRAIEGKDGGTWILLDFLTVIVHIFDPASREFYNLERLQKPQNNVNISDAVSHEKSE